MLQVGDLFRVISSPYGARLYFGSLFRLIEVFSPLPDDTLIANGTIGIVIEVTERYHSEWVRVCIAEQVGWMFRARLEKIE